MGKLSPEAKAPECRLCETTGPIGEKEYRLIVVQSSTLGERKARSLRRLAEKEEKAFLRKARHVAREVYPCEEDAKEAAERLRGETPKCSRGEVRVMADTVVEERRPRGRPRTGTAPPLRSVWRVEARVLGARRGAPCRASPVGVDVRADP